MIRRALSRAVMCVTVSGIENNIFWDLRRTIDQIALSAAAHDSCEHGERPSARADARGGA